MTNTEKKFEDYLETICFGANPMVLDDDMPDFFDTWLGNQDVEDMIRHCNNFLSTSIAQAIAEERERVVVDYTDFLIEYSYVDSDVWAEEPKAVERYLSSLDKPLKKGIKIYEQHNQKTR